MQTTAKLGAVERGIVMEDSSMMSNQQIEDQSRAAASRACKMNMKPYVVWPEDMEMLRSGIKPEGMQIPFLGDYVPRGWVKVDEMFVDSSGFGSDSEPAMTMEKMLKSMEVNLGYAVVTAGQFQVYVGVYQRVIAEPAEGLSI